ncbi:MAG: helix-turn-helix domain-containing protein [Caldilineaceae bacterium]|nr:helix-turn-helix domain-containing protein [Caldilineaceae bacterium]
MPEKTVAAGLLLRDLRRKRKLTLQQAARLLHSSAPVLSRKERGLLTLQRKDIEMAVAAFELDDWEAYQLWIAAGFAPSPPKETSDIQFLRHMIRDLLAQIRYPAFASDLFSYVQAWNEGIERIWTPSAVAPPVHILDDLFSGRIRTRMGSGWADYLLRALRIFRLKTRPIANDPRFRRLLRQLEAKHGAQFVEMWNTSQQAVSDDDLATGQPMPVIVQHDSPLGSIEYLVTQGVWANPYPWELNVYLPLGTENTSRYLAMMEGTDLSRVFFPKE